MRFLSFLGIAKDDRYAAVQQDILGSLLWLYLYGITLACLLDNNEVFPIASVFTLLMLTYC